MEENSSAQSRHKNQFEVNQNETEIDKVET